MSELRRKRLFFDTAVLTDTGMVRENNEDSSMALDINEPNTLGAESYGIYLVADGMGGHQAGEVASEMAVQVISATLLDSLRQKSELLSPSHFVKQAIERANTEIYNMACSNPQLFAMGTTVTLGFRLDNELYLGHVGDSRAYLIRKGRIRQLTEDHSLNQTGSKDKLTLHSGDSLVFCTDGLTGYVSDGEILDCVQKGDSADSICRDLIHLANLGGGGDNISVIVIKIKLGKSKNTPAKGRGRQNPDGV